MPSLSNMLLQDELQLIYYSRKLHFHTYIVQQPTRSPSTLSSTHNKFIANVTMVLSVLVCTIICSLALYSIIRCVLLRCTRLIGSEHSARSQSTSARFVTSGIKKKALKTFPVVKYWHGLELPGLGKECCICLGDFCEGEQVKILPKCNHGFHVRCIDKWLASHSSCPTCRQSLNEICKKILTRGEKYSSSASSQPEEQGPSNTLINVSLSPLQHEGFLRNN